MRRVHTARAARERGAVSVLGGAIIVLLAALALVLALPLAQGMSQRRSSATAADAAALAAAQEWSNHLKRRQATLEASPPEVFWTFPGTSVSASRSPLMAAEAEELAAANDATLVSMSVQPSRMEVTVRVRMNGEAVDGSGVHAEKSATARVDLRGGICRVGNRMGVRDGTCITVPPPDVTTPPPPLPAYRADVTLVR